MGRSDVLLAAICCEIPAPGKWSPGTGSRARLVAPNNTDCMPLAATRLKMNYAMVGPGCIFVPRRTGFGRGGTRGNDVRLSVSILSRLLFADGARHLGLRGLPELPKRIWGDSEAVG